MAAVDIGARDNPPINDDLDNLFNYEVDNDIFKDVDINMDIAPKAPAGQDKDKSVFGGLGLDEEIQVRKKRVPIAKLDETRYDGSSVPFHILILQSPFSSWHTEIETHYTGTL